MRNISRRVLILLLCAALLLPVLAGCAGPDAGETTEKSKTTGTDATNPSTTNPGGTTKPGGTSKPTEPSIPDRFDPNTLLYLVNALSFEGDWEVIYKKSNIF